MRTDKLTADKNGIDGRVLLHDAGYQRRVSEHCQVVNQLDALAELYGCRAKINKERVTRLDDVSGLNGNRLFSSMAAFARSEKLRSNFD